MIAYPTHRTYLVSLLKPDDGSPYFFSIHIANIVKIINNSKRNV